MTTLTLIMIVKNESKIIERCLDSVSKHIDYIVISDTGSTDGTPELIEKWLEKNKKKGKVYCDTWKNFGYNRTKSVENGKDWLINEIKMTQKEMSKNYFLTIDADMLFVYHNDFNKDDLVKSDIWHVIQKNDIIQYYNTRLMRSSLIHKCIGVTHEYWSCESPDSTTSNLDTVHIDDRGDGGAKADKFTRDIRLLKDGLISEPDNIRYHFYLAQSYADSDDIENGLIWYQKRIDMGGWNEEIFVSHRQRGELYKKKGDIPNAINEWMKAYQVIPSRVETLHRIIHHYRNTRNYHLAVLFLRTALKARYPKDCILFIEHPIYEYKLIEELSIVAYYANLKREGAMACDYLKFLSNDVISSHAKNNTMINSFFYIHPIPSSSHYNLIVPTRPPFISSGASLFYSSSKNKVNGIVRAVNYSINDSFHYDIRDPNRTVRTENYWIEYDLKNNKIEDVYPIENRSTTKKIREAHIKGFEDIRLCVHNNKLYGLAVDWEYGEKNHPSVVLLFFEKDEKERYFIRNVRHITYQNTKCQKNWTLLSKDSKLYAVYSHHPFTLLELSVLEAHEKEEKEEKEYTIDKIQYNTNGYDLSEIRGSASPIFIEQKKEWLFLVHEVIFKDTRKYYHRFLRYDQDWNLIGVSEPFYFKNFYIEFSLSILYDDEKDMVMIPYSTRDNSTEMVCADYKNIKWLPKTMNEFRSFFDTL